MKSTMNHLKSKGEKLGEYSENRLEYGIMGKITLLFFPNSKKINTFY